MPLNKCKRPHEEPLESGATVWRSTDPREIIHKRHKIIIYTGTEAHVGTVESKHSYCIWILNKLSVGQGGFVGANDEWPAGWQWTWAPLTA